MISRFLSHSRTRSVSRAVLTLGACCGGFIASGPAAAQDLVQKPAASPDGWGFDTAGMNRGIIPGNDFFGYANGTYLKHLVIPRDASRYGPFNILRDLSLSRQHDLLEKAAAAGQAVPATHKLGSYYASFMNVDRINALGAMPLNDDLRKIRQAATFRQFAVLAGAANRSFGFSPFMLGIEQNQKDPNCYMLVLDQGMGIGVSGGLGLPDLSYYSDPKLAEKKKAYEAYAAKMLSRIHWSDPGRAAQEIVALETHLASVELPRDETRDPIALFNPMSVARLGKLAPDFNWMVFLKSAGVPEEGLSERIINVREPEAIAAMARILAQTPPKVLRAWYAFHLVNNAAPYLSDDFSREAFDFNGRQLSGIAEQPVRWKRAAGASNEAMGWALGKIYVEKWFPEEARQKITALTENLKKAFQKRLEANPWMDEPTRTAALNKLDRFAIQVGYPNHWRDYSSLLIRRDDLYGNTARAAAFNWNYQLNRLDRAVDRNEWEMTPQTVNAYNNPTMNEIVFPAAILQPPFFDPEGDMAVNYGGIGGVIGHEMSHAFDDQGRHYGADGRLEDWWSPKAAKSFEALANRLVAQYSAQEVLPGMYVNGRMTLGENIADLGGLNLALEAYGAYASARQEDPAVESRHGFTGIQRVFLGWAQVWREKDRLDALKRQILTDEHAPAITRVNMPVRNIDSWYSAFQVKTGDALYLSPDQRVKMW